MVGRMAAARQANMALRAVAESLYPDAQAGSESQLDWPGMGF